MQRRLLTLYLGAAFLATLVFMAHSVLQVRSAEGVIDLHAYWYAGHFVRQGINPYQAFFEGVEPALPIRYLGGVTVVAPPVAQPGLTFVPGNLAPLLLLLSAFSFFSWPTAKLVWSICNFILVLIIPWLVVRVLPKPLPWRYTLFIVLTYYCLQGTRIAIWVGQPTILVFTLMLASLLTYRRFPVGSGVLLGIALSKYSIALPILLFFLYRRRYVPVAVSLLVQIAGLLILAAITRTNPVETVESYFRLILVFSGMAGIHLGSLPGYESWLAYALFAAATLWVARTLWMRFRRPESQDAYDAIHVLALLVLWILLAVYHRAYDTTLTIFYIALLVYGLYDGAMWQISRSRQTLTALWLAFFICMMAIPSSAIEPLLPTALRPGWYQVVSQAMTFTLIVALFSVLWFLAQTARNVEAEPVRSAAPGPNRRPDRKVEPV